MFKKLIITNDTNYIGERDDYFETNNIKQAKSFTWCWLFAPKEDFLTGIKSRFGQDYYFKYI